MDRLIVRIPKSDGEIESLRQIRNECRTFMTRDQNEISPEQQATWWKQKDKGLLFLFYLASSDVGYGRIIRGLNHGVFWLSGGLRESYRDEGLGKELFGFLADVVTGLGEFSALEVLATNERAIKVYRSLGFKVVFDDNDSGVVMMNRNAR